MQKDREVAKIYKWKPFASRPIGRPKKKTGSFKHAAWSKDSILCFWRRHIVSK